MSKLRRRRLRKNLRSLHPIRNKEREARTDLLLRHYQQRMIRDYSLPRWLFRAFVVMTIVALVAGYIAGHHTSPLPYNSQQTRL